MVSRMASSFSTEESSDTQRDESESAVLIVNEELEMPSFEHSTLQSCQASTRDNESATANSENMIDDGSSLKLNDTSKVALESNIEDIPTESSSAAGDDRVMVRRLSWSNRIKGKSIKNSIRTQCLLLW